VQCVKKMCLPRCKRMPTCCPDGPLQVSAVCDSVLGTDRDLRSHLCNGSAHSTT
jgi:hypothetical protein